MSAATLVFQHLYSTSGRHFSVIWVQSGITEYKTGINVLNSIVTDILVAKRHWREVVVSVPRLASDVWPDLVRVPEKVAFFSLSQRTATAHKTHRHSLSIDLRHFEDSWENSSRIARNRRYKEEWSTRSVPLQHSASGFVYCLWSHERTNLPLLICVFITLCVLFDWKRCADPFTYLIQ